MSLKDRFYRWIIPDRLNVFPHHECWWLIVSALRNVLIALCLYEQTLLPLQALSDDESEQETQHANEEISEAA